MSIAELFANGDQFLHELAKTALFGNLPPGTIYRRSSGDDLGDGLSTAGMSQRVGGAVSRGVFLRTVAVRLATLTESGRQRAATEIADLSQTGREVLAV